MEAWDERDIFKLDRTWPRWCLNVNDNFSNSLYMRVCVTETNNLVI
jgi:hypothetical protein